MKRKDSKNIEMLLDENEVVRDSRNLESRRRALRVVLASGGALFAGAAGLKSVAQSSLPAENIAAQSAINALILKRDTLVDVANFTGMSVGESVRRDTIFPSIGKRFSDLLIPSAHAQEEPIWTYTVTVCLNVTSSTLTEATADVEVAAVVEGASAFGIELPDPYVEVYELVQNLPLPTSDFEIDATANSCGELGRVRLSIDFNANGTPQLLLRLFNIDTENGVGTADSDPIPPFMNFSLSQGDCVLPMLGDQECSPMTADPGDDDSATDPPL